LCFYAKGTDLAKSTPRFAIEVDLPEHRRILFGSMVEAAERHAGVLRSHWLCVDASHGEPIHVRALPDPESTARIRIVLAFPGQVRRDMALHWPLRSAELFETLNQASLWLDDAGQQSGMRSGTRLDAKLAGTMLLDWLALRARGEVRAMLRTGRRAFLHLDAETDRCVAVDPTLSCLDDIRRTQLSGHDWVPGVAPATGKLLGSSAQCLWQLAECSADAGLVEPLGRVPIHLRGWPPQVVRGPASWTRLLQQLRQQELMAADLGKRTAVNQRELAWFLNGCLATGYVRASMESTTARAPTEKRLPQPGGGRLWAALNSIRAALGISAHSNGWSGTDRT
jgi:hypothetical protein